MIICEECYINTCIQVQHRIGIQWQGLGRSCRPSPCSQPMNSQTCLCREVYLPKSEMDNKTCQCWGVYHIVSIKAIFTIGRKKNHKTGKIIFAPYFKIVQNCSRLSISLLFIIVMVFCSHGSYIPYESPYTAE